MTIPVGITLTDAFTVPGKVPAETASFVHIYCVIREADASILKARIKFYADKTAYDNNYTALYEKTEEWNPSMINGSPFDTYPFDLTSLEQSGNSVERIAYNSLKDNVSMYAGTLIEE